MKINKLLIKNYKLLKSVVFDVNEDLNIFVGENDSGKSTILEVLSIITSGKLNGYSFDKQLKANLFNDNIRNEYRNSLQKSQTPNDPPQIILEAYCESDDATYLGTENELRENCPGIRVLVDINQENAKAYQKLLAAKEIYDIPVELYSVSYHYFSGEPVVFRFCPLKAAFIDTTRKDYSNVVDRFVSENITTYLSPQEQVDLSTAYRKSRYDFHLHDVVTQLNKSVINNVHIGNRSLTIDLREEDPDEWKRQMSVVVDSTPFENVGFGSQNTIKIELALKNSANQVNMVLMEEPENNLSFSNMVKLVQHVESAEGKQIFISTHSSFIANKLNLNNIFVVYSGEVIPFSALDDDTVKYFTKLPGYDTLRLILAEKVILVEGPTDDLIIQRAFYDEKGKLPSAEGIDIIVVDSLAFKRYCEIAKLLSKKVVIVTDNDGNINNNITEKYADYINLDNFTFIYEKNEKLKTIEPSVLEVNTDNGVVSTDFSDVISKNGSMKGKSKDEILSFMSDNKTEWAFRVFDSNKKIKFPEYIKDVIKQYD